ncbi:MAG: class I SAM-dependent methyltransferase [Elusimicrobia bacterium]|nr:class I SAM-dependent methyltransferase [Elusimicrobiota bacterium]
MASLWTRILRRLRRETSLRLPSRHHNIFALDARDFRSGLGDTAWVLHGLVRHYKPEVCVEIGSALGKSAVYMGAALKANGKGKLYAIDPHAQTQWNDADAGESSLDILRANLKRFGVADYVDVMRDFSDKVGASWDKPIDVLFIDGGHAYEEVKRDWDLFAPHVRQTGIVLVHDAMWDYLRESPHYREDMGVPRFLDGLRREGYPVITLPNDFGLSLVQTTRQGFPLLKENGRA